MIRYNHIQQFPDIQFKRLTDICESAFSIMLTELKMNLS